MASANVPRHGSASLSEDIESVLEPAEADTIVDLRDTDEVVVHIFDRPTEPATSTLPTLARDEGLLGAKRVELAVKRFIDIVGSAIGLILLSPLFIAVAAAIKLTSKGPVFFKQTRIGKNGEPFTFLKFRSMKVGAESTKRELSTLNEASGPIFKIKHDPRVTPIGRLLRKSSIDELPQLIHVLSGRMSLVGIRPPVPEEVAQYSREERQRLLIKPGLTCIWQVSGRSDLDFDTWIHMDLEYISKWSLRLDLQLLVRTVGAVLSGRGAY